jgi:hypothetical protein
VAGQDGLFSQENLKQKRQMNMWKSKYEKEIRKAYPKATESQIESALKLKKQLDQYRSVSFATKVNKVVEAIASVFLFIGFALAFPFILIIKTIQKVI